MKNITNLGILRSACAFACGLMLYVSYAVAADEPAMGVTLNSDGSHTFCLAAPGKTSVSVVGSWNSYDKTASGQSMTPADVTVDGNPLRYFSLTLPASLTGKEFYYYYMIDGETAVSDPYARLVLDPQNDKYIASEVFPDLPPYPANMPDNTTLAWYGDDLLHYVWKNTSFSRPDKENLVIYELLLRDFTGTEGKADGNGTLRKAIEKIPYIKSLGVNAVELMPVTEFDGNISWGYNPNFYFAPDKAYGTPQDYKEFIDICHENGIAVILDMVFNHADWQHPWYRMYNPGQSPFFNARPPHYYNVFNDWRQEYPLVLRQERDVVKFWLEEYKVDGFRFDLVKGLGVNSSYANAGETATNAFNQSRIDRMKEIHDAMRQVADDAYFINENFATPDEENGMARDGELNWASFNNAGCQFAMGWEEQSDLSGIDPLKSGRLAGSTVSFLESHDEQRLAYKQDQWAPEGVKGNRKVSMQRLSSAAAQLILAPGTHMIWMFSEMGNAQNTKNSDGGNNTDPKIVSWNLLDNEYNRGLKDCYGSMIKLRIANPQLFNGNDSYSNLCSDWARGRTIFSTTADQELYCVINPNVTGDITVQVPFRSNNQESYTISSKSYASNPLYDAAAKEVTVEPGCYALFTTKNLAGREDIALPEGNPATVLGGKGVIAVCGLNGTAYVYALDGTLAGELCVEDEGEIPVPAGVYVVRAGEKAVKVLVK